jgi:hypothetical protein
MAKNCVQHKHILCGAVSMKMKPVRSHNDPRRSAAVQPDRS